MDQDQIKAAGVIIHESAVEFLANKHGTTVEMVVQALAQGHVKVTQQYNQLCDTAVDMVLSMRAAQ